MTNKTSSNVIHVDFRKSNHKEEMCKKLRADATNKMNLIHSSFLSEILDTDDFDDLETIVTNGLLEVYNVSNEFYKQMYAIEYGWEGF